MPAHLFPALIDDHLWTVPMIDDMVTHPLGKSDMMRYQFGRVASQCQTFGLTLGRSIQKAHLNARKFNSARGCVEFAGRDRISAEQKMLSGFLVFDRQLHDLFHSLVPPPKAPLGGDTQSAQLADRNFSGDLCSNQLAHARFSDAARACHKEEHSHRSVTEALAGGNKEIPMAQAPADEVGNAVFFLVGGFAQFEEFSRNAGKSVAVTHAAQVKQVLETFRETEI